MEGSEEALWEEILAKDRMADTFYDEYLKIKLAATLLRITYTKEFGTYPLIDQFDQPR